MQITLEIINDTMYNNINNVARLNKGERREAYG